MLKKLAILAGLSLSLALPAFAATPVNINTADAETIARSLDGIGPAKAKAIVAYREEHGPFKSMDELSQVKGIGTAVVERNHDAILLSGAGAKAAPDAPAKPRHNRKSGTANQASTED
jgi:competence protein ComEA